MTGEPTHTASKERMAPELMFSSERAPQLSKTASKVQWPLRFAFGYVRPITHRYRRKTVEEVPLQQSSESPRNTIRAPPCNYQLLPRKCSGHYASLSAIFSPLLSISVLIFTSIGITCKSIVQILQWSNVSTTIRKALIFHK